MLGGDDSDIRDALEAGPHSSSKHVHSSLDLVDGYPVGSKP